MNKIPWWQPQIGNIEKELVQKVLSDNYPNEGNLTALFEQELSKLFNVKYAISVTSGTAAMFLSLKALGISVGDEVIVPDITFIATANAVDMTGATPVLVDIDPATLTIDTNALIKAITPKTKAVIPVHVTGRPADMTKIMKIAEKNNLYIIEDACEGLHSKLNGINLGTFGKTGCFSLSPNKIITTGQGGIIITNDEKLNLVLREFKDQGRPVRGTGGDDIHYIRGYNFKFTDIQAALGIGQLTYLRKRAERLIRTHVIYLNELGGVNGIQLLPFNLKGGELPLWTDVLSDRRDELANYLLLKGISSRKFWLPIHTQLPYKLGDEYFPQSSIIGGSALWLPSSYTLSDNDILCVSNVIKSFFKSH